MNGRRRVFSALDGLKCDRAVVWSVFMWWCLVVLPGNVESAPPGICAMDGCNCTVKAHRWINVKCVFSNDQDVELLEGTIPSDAMEVEVSHCRELRIQSGAFADGSPLKRVHVSGIYSLVAKRQAFQNLSAPNTHLEVSECNSVILESHAFRNTRGTLSVSISRCRHVGIKPNAFSRLLWIAVREVPTLELSSNAFKLEASQHGRHGPATKIMFQSVRITELPTAVFPSAIAEVRMDDIWTKVIRKDAFCAMTIYSVTISNASILEIETGAFSDRALIQRLEFVDVRLQSIERGAFRAGHDNLTIQYSRLSEVETGAIDISAATVSFNNNEFQNLQQGAIVLHQWNHIAIDYNLFVDLNTDAITAEVEATSAPNFEFSFTGNHIHKARPGSLKFAAISQRVNTARVGNNYFKEKCRCTLDKWIREVTGKNSSVSWMMDSSYCVVDQLLDKCFNLPQGYMSMRNFTKVICMPGDHIYCEKPSAKPEPSVSPPSVGPHVYPRHKGYFDLEMSDSDQLQREKRIIVVICVVAVFTVLVVILASGILYMRRNGVCPKLTSGHLMNLASLFSPSSGMTAATSARSISRLSVHEYAGLQPETRILEVETQPEATEDEEEDAEGLYPYTETKATQTLPEELTEEYLRDLRERLNDPDNYNQARDMIEHLYDLIKVEESCNNNNDRQPSDREENAYDVIRPKQRRKGPPKPTVSVGTKVPSLEKLLPGGIQPRPPLTEYTEPRDQRTNEQNHLYAELPGDETVPSTSRLSQPILATLAGRAPQPLPPDVVNDHLINGHSSQTYSTPTTENHRPPDSPKFEPIRNQGRPMSFLKALGESILGGSKTGNNKRPNSLLCEYAEPSDATTHLYSELPEPQTLTPACKMANRPLPTKPDQDSVNMARV
ncbi:PREDICTED: uncharacterized protein LOC107186538 [Dufourea novaeangliae]|uniref:Uncharacterized protein n=2 Tax=Dufourea novaeangliae TaxID=178035 RepID=A0A154P924_DUFNO|nr:PREDICTED: uncharacterized protein LOC107186538 [Dufourea novaeangliae]KZC08415.1 hypothetical protein WN55_09319 [Dufourea novaeangliae]